MFKRLSKYNNLFFNTETEELARLVEGQMQTLDNVHIIHGVKSKWTKERIQSTDNSNMSIPGYASPVSSRDNDAETEYFLQQYKNERDDEAFDSIDTAPNED